MGLRDWILKREVRNLGKRNSALLSQLNEELKETTSDYKTALKEAETIAKIQETRRRIHNMQDGFSKASKAISGEDDDEEEDDEEDDENDDVAQNLLNNLIIKPLSKKFQGGEATTPQPSELSPSKQKAINALTNLSDAEVEKLIKAFGI